MWEWWIWHATSLIQIKVAARAGRFEDVLNAVAGQASPDQPVYLVGGAVRDYLLGRPIYDWDFVLEGDVRPISKKIANLFGGAYYLLDEERNISRVIIDFQGEKLVLDFAASRADSLAGDLEKRDYTINAMAMDITAPGQIIDPLGGKQDLFDQKIHFCQPDSIKSDPVRILRGIRLCMSLGFQLENSTEQVLRAAVPLLTTVSTERKRDELFKILGLGRSKTSLEMMDEMGILQILLPEEMQIKDVEQSPPHKFDVWEHTLETLFYLDILLDGILSSGREAVAHVETQAWMNEPLMKFQPGLENHFQRELPSGRSRRSLLLFSALMHDIGKPGRKIKTVTGRIRFLGHEHLGSELAEQVAWNWALSNDEVVYIKQIVGQHMRIHSMTRADQLPDRRAIHRFFRDSGENGVDICILTLADSLATYGGMVPQDLWKNQSAICDSLLETWFEKKKEVVNPPKLLSGNDIMQMLNLRPGPVIGRIVLDLREAQGAGEVLTVEDAVNYIRGWTLKQVEGESYDNISSS